ncbi:glycosyltransferase, group 2 family protein [Clostridiales bacterium oral taxon 876 str. F0540]|nr:glycosyltransferase, group 2 family protein [Clostridiales bacterium oral taxon 876 str. F0540]
MNSLKTSIVILTYNKLEYTKVCIDSIRKFTEPGTYELIVVDNNSTDGSVEWIKAQNDIIPILNSENLGFPKGCNQGIEVSTGENILLLNNDTIVTPNWLENLSTALYSSSNIGAVGAITNSCANYQAINVALNDFNEIIEFALRNNISNEKLWEERLRLIGFCLLIKKEVINKIGFLDEIFTPGNFEDDDYSFRIRKAGYKLLLCNDTFIYHFGHTSFKENSGFGSLLTKNRLKFEHKWELDPYYIANIDIGIKYAIGEERDSKFRLLEIGCSGGATLLNIKNNFQNAELYGIEKCENAVTGNEAFAKIIIGNENVVNRFEERYFDYIIFKYEHHNLNTLKKLKSVLNDTGKIIIRADKDLDNIEKLINLTIYENGLEIDKTIEDGLGKLYVLNNKKHDIKNYEELYLKLENGEEIYNENILSVFKDIMSGKINLNDFIKEICQNTTNKLYNLNLLAICAYNNRFYDYVIPFLEKALEFDFYNKDTLINLCNILYNFEEYTLAQDYLNRLKDDEYDEELISLRQSINHKLYTKKEPKFLIRRIENNIELEESIERLLQLLSSGEIDIQSVVEIIEKDIIKKEEVLNIIAISAYQNNLYDYILPFLEKAYSINDKNKDTVYNLSYILHLVGEDEIALRYLEKYSEEDNDIKELIRDIKE